MVLIPRAPYSLIHPGQRGDDAAKCTAWKAYVQKLDGLGTSDSRNRARSEGAVLVGGPYDLCTTSLEDAKRISVIVVRVITTLTAPQNAALQRRI